MKTESVDGSSGNRGTVLIRLIHRVGVDRDKEVALILVGFISTLLKGKECVIIARQNDIDIFQLFFDKIGKLKRHTEIDILLFYIIIDCTGILAAVAGIDHNSEFILLRFALGCRGRHGKEGEEKHEEK